MAQDKQFHTEKPIQPNGMKIVRDMLDTPVQGITKVIETKITGNSKRDDDGHIVYRDKTDADGKPVLDNNGKQKRERVPEFEPIHIKFTVDFSGATLNQIFNGVCTPSGIPVMVANSTRPHGQLACEQLNGTTIMYTDLLKGGRVAKSNEAIIMNNIHKITDPVAKERMVKTLLEMLG